MSKIFNIGKNLIFIGLLIAAILFVWFAISNHNNSIEVSEGKIKDIKTMVQLCTVEVYNEVVIVDTLENNKVLCAKQKQRGSVSFDLENLEFDNVGDTAVFILPAEIVKVYEATDDKAWEIIDEHDLDFLDFDGLNLAEENFIKRKCGERSKQELYQNGIVERARSEGKENLERFLKIMCHKPVIVMDPTPKGAYYDEYQ